MIDSYLRNIVFKYHNTDCYKNRITYINDYEKNILHITAFLLIGCLLLKALSCLFDGGYWFSKGWIYDRTSRYAAFSEEPPGQIDVINLGDSLSICAITPPELYRDFGITAYNLGQDMQSLTESYYALEHALKTQSPKVVLLETNSIFYESPLEISAEKTFSEAMMTAFPFVRYHNLWKIPFKHRSIRTYFKGYTINETRSPFTFHEKYTFDNTVRYPIQKKEHFHLMRIRRLCRDNRIHLVLYSSASIRNYYTMRKHTTLSDYVRDYDFEFIDANYDQNIVKMNWDTDTWDDGDHLNLSGCRKMTGYLGHFLKSECGMPDHRNDPAYRSWDEMLPIYDREVEKMQGKSYADVERELNFPKY